MTRENDPGPGSWFEYRQLLRELHRTTGSPPMRELERLCAEEYGGKRVPRALSRTAINGYLAPADRPPGTDRDVVGSLVHCLLLHGGRNGLRPPPPRNDPAWWRRRYDLLSEENERRRRERGPSSGDLPLAETGHWDTGHEVALGWSLADVVFWPPSGVDHLDKLAGMIRLAHEIGVPHTALPAARQLERWSARELPTGHPARLAARHAAAVLTSHAGAAPAQTLRTVSELVRECRKHLGARHPLTVFAGLWHAGSTGRCGDWAEARRLYRLLAAEPSPDHTALRADLLAGWGAARALGHLGRWEDAREELERLLPDVDTLIGPSHPAALEAKGAHARAVLMSGDARGAAARYEALIAQADELGAIDQPTLLGLRRGLAACVHHMGEVAGGRGDPPGTTPIEVVYRGVIEDSIAVLGREHPATLGALRELGVLLTDISPLDAVRTLEEVTEEGTELLGSSHPEVLRARHALALAHREAGRPREALIGLGEVLGRQRQKLGHDHPDTVHTRHHLGTLLAETEQYQRAVALLDDVHANRRRTLGPDHPSTLAVRQSLAELTWRIDGTRAARSSFESLHRTCLRVLGPEHRQTLVTRLSLARLTWEEDPRTALAEYRRVGEAQARVLGERHPATLWTRFNAAVIVHELDGPGAAVEEYRKVLDAREEILGTGHPATRDTRHHLSEALEALARAQTPGNQPPGTAAGEG
ncbi:hypothetical protein GCM10027160_01750 [Streptomyces calidiresistens]|uniref:Tetratricopeptide repeat protein n=1 Tax=Streptomyces calidiresistens TaxID=1485586 RepID=A0A7W3XYE7_9ACTN|nr:tetratricopeptide repeat protein [Streptomyces calidiresistens]MBB0231878.1 tetratricopeptide repeat protein [Streptomyces calidiresistens]